MKDLKMSEILEMQKGLQKINAGKWAPLVPTEGRNCLLWMLEEIGEVISIIKNSGENTIITDKIVREAFVEEFADIFVFFTNSLICYGISPEEFSGIFVKKYKENIGRDFERADNDVILLFEKTAIMGGSMKDLKISEIMEMQKRLQKKYEGKWAPLVPIQGRNSLLWMVEELGEVISIIKKRGEVAIMNDKIVREVLIEELADMMMYFNDALICYDISPEEISKAFVKKHEKNMGRDFVKEHNAYLSDEEQGKLFE